MPTPPLGKPRAKPAATPAPVAYRDSCGTCYEYAHRPEGVGLYRADAAPGTPPVQDAEAFTKSQKWSVFQPL